MIIINIIANNNDIQRCFRTNSFKSKNIQAVLQDIFQCTYISSVLRAK